jgi:hypothetical protein
MPKPEIEFTAATATPITACEGDVGGLTERVLAVDSANGTVTRILYFAPGTDTSPNGVMRHDFWEEVYIISGAITDVRLNKTFTAGMYAVRPPHMEHGPWIASLEQGAQTFEVRYQ